jgi:hypothetical protein
MVMAGQRPRRAGPAGTVGVLAEHPMAALPDEVWPDQSPFPASDTAVS